MGTLKQLYEADGLGHHVTVGHPEFRADQLAKKRSDPEKAGPDTLSAEAAAFQEVGGVCRDLLNEKPEGYLSQWDGEEDNEFSTRKRNSRYSFVNFYEDAVGGLIDKAFSKDLNLTEAPPAIDAFWENVTRKKTKPVNGTQFARGACSKSLGQGGTPIILIDHPRREFPAETKGEEDRQGLGPYFHLIRPWDLIAVEEDDDGNVTEIRFHSSREERVGAWGRKVTPVIVVLKRGEPGGFSTRQVYVENESDGEYEEDPDEFATLEPPSTAPAEVRALFREIPQVPLPTEGENYFARPAMRNVAMLNVLHFRKRTDYDVAEAVSSVPMGAWFGVTEEDMAAYQRGPYRNFWTAKSPQDAAFEDISFKFDSAQIALKTLESIEHYIAQKSKEPLSQRATGEQKSTIRMLDEAEKLSRLQSWAIAWLQSLQVALGWAGAWMGIAPADVGELSYLDEVFEALSEQPTWSSLTEFLATLSLIPETAWPFAIEEAKRYGIIADTHDTDELIGMLSAGALETELE